MPLFKKNKKENVKTAPKVDSDGDEVDATEEGLGGPQGKADESGEIKYTDVDVDIPRTQFIEGQGPSVTVEKQSRTVEKGGVTYTTVTTTKTQSGGVQYDTSQAQYASVHQPRQQQGYQQQGYQQPYRQPQPQSYPMKPVSYQGGYSGPYTHGANYGDMYDAPAHTLKAPGFDYVNWKPIGYRRKRTNGKEDFYKQAYLLAPYVKAVVASACEGTKEREGQSYTQAPPPPELGPRTPNVILER